MKTEGPGHCIAAAVVTLQLVICAQLFVSLFPKWDGGLAVGPNLVCMMGQDDRVECTPISGNAAVCDAVAFCSYAPLPLTLFAGLSFLFGARLPDADALRLSAAGQALAATAALVAVVSSVVGYGNLVLLPGFATAIANSVCTCVEMGVAAALCSARVPVPGFPPPPSVRTLNAASTSSASFMKYIVSLWTPVLFFFSSVRTLFRNSPFSFRFASPPSIQDGRSRRLSLISAHKKHNFGP